MNKIEVLKTVLSSAKSYSENLENKNILFLFNDDIKQAHCFEIVFEPRHFHHLTGTKIVNSNIKSSVEFYNMCLKNNLSEHDFDLAEDGTTLLKMAVLPSLMEVHKMAKMIGDYNDCKPRLYTDKLAGSQVGCMGFVKEKEEDKYYIPNTVLKEDIRNVTKKANRLIAIYSKEIREVQYNHLCYAAKGIPVDDIKMPIFIKEKIDIENLIIEFKKP